MGLPRKLKDFLLFNEGRNCLGEVPSVTVPKLVIKMDEWRGAGMTGPVKLANGHEALDMEWSAGGPLRDVLGQFGTPTVDGLFLRFVGAYQAQDEEYVDAVEIFLRGRHEEIDMGEQKSGEGGEFKVKTALAYYRLEWNGDVVIELDPLRGIFMVEGEDMNEPVRAALGM
jgi:P2 family phage contractile tail tube protein